MTAADPWSDLRALTAARLALGRCGASLPTDEILRFGLAHAKARDAVQRQLDPVAFAAQLRDAGMQTLQVVSAARDRTSFLLRPDLGRRLGDESRALLAGAAKRERAAAAGEIADRPVANGAAAAAALDASDDSFAIDLLLVVADGLSSPAVERNALPMLHAIRRMAPPGWRIGPVIVATQARVALGDEIGGLLGASLVAMMIGERPGLSSPDSLGIYLTWQPRPGRHDAERNCISNIRPEGLGWDAAARRLWWLSGQARQLQLTGVQLKDHSDSAQIADAAIVPTIAANLPPRKP